MGNSLNEVKKKQLNDRLSILIKQYEAVSEQLRVVLDKADEVKLKEKLSSLEGEINEVEIELKAIPNTSNKNNIGGRKEVNSNEYVVPTGQLIQISKFPDDSKISLPSGFLYVGEGKVPGGHLLFRKIDGHIVLILPKGGKAQSTYLIDKYHITNIQYAKFINLMAEQKLLEIAFEGKLRVIFNQYGQRIAGDAQTFWDSHPVS